MPGSLPDAQDLLFGGYTQSTRLLQLTTSLGANCLLAECERGDEGLSEGFVFHISALSTDAGIGLRALIAQPALLELLTAASAHGWRAFHGHISMLISKSRSLFDSALDTFIDGIDNWAVKTMAGAPKISLVIAELRSIQKQGPRMIDDAYGEDPNWPCTKNLADPDIIYK